MQIITLQITEIHHILETFGNSENVELLKCEHILKCRRTKKIIHVFSVEYWPQHSLLT